MTDGVPIASTDDSGRFYLALFVLSSLVCVLLITDPLGWRPPPGTFIRQAAGDNTPIHHTVIAETIAMTGVAIGIVVAGAGIFAPLYISI